MESCSPAVRLALSALLAAVVGAGASGACTQDVVVVMGGGGQGGGEGSAIVGMGVGGASSQGGQATQVAVAVSSGMGECSTPAPVGAIANCTTGIASSSGGGVQCEQVACDGADNTWTASCGPRGCTCLFNDAPVCTCTFVAPAQGCDQVQGNGCCPFPWFDPGGV